MEPSYESIKFPGKAQIFYHPHGEWTPIEWAKQLARIGEKLLGLHIVTLADPFYGKRGRAEYKVARLEVYVPTEPGDPIVLVPALEIVKEDKFGLGSELSGSATEAVGQKLNRGGWRVAQFPPDVVSGRYVQAAWLLRPEAGGWLVPAANPYRGKVGSLDGSFGPPPGGPDLALRRAAKMIRATSEKMQLSAGGPLLGTADFYAPTPIPCFEAGELRADQLNAVVDKVNELSLSMQGIKDVISTMPGERPRMQEALAHTPSNPTNPPASVQEKSVSDKRFGEPLPTPEPDVRELGPGIIALFPPEPKELIQPRYCNHCGHDYGCMCPRDAPEHKPVNRCAPREPKVIL